MLFGAPSARSRSLILQMKVLCHVSMQALFGDVVDLRLELGKPRSSPRIILDCLSKPVIYKLRNCRRAPPRCDDGNRTSVAMALARLSDTGSPSTSCSKNHATSVSFFCCRCGVI